MFGYLSCIYVSSAVCCCFLPGGVEILNSLGCGSPCLVSCYRYVLPSCTFPHTHTLDGPAVEAETATFPVYVQHLNVTSDLEKVSECVYPAAMLPVWCHSGRVEGRGRDGASRGIKMTAPAIAWSGLSRSPSPRTGLRRLAELHAAAAAASAPCVNRQCSPLLLQCGMSCTAGPDGVPSRHVDYNLTRQAKRKNGPLLSGSKHNILIGCFVCMVTHR